MNNIVDLEDDSTAYIADLPINQFTYPPSCLIDEDFIRTLFQDFDFYHDSVVIKTKIGRNLHTLNLHHVRKHGEQLMNWITSDLIMFQFVWS